MKYAAIVLLLFVSLEGCKSNRTSNTPESAKGSQSSKSGDTDAEHAACLANALNPNDCGKYRVVSYDATWRNDLGNEGQFVLERDGVSIRAFCGSPNCYVFIDSVGKEVEADKNTTGLLTRYEPNCSDKLYVKIALERYKMMTGKEPTVADVCWQSLVIEKMQVK